MNKKLAIALSLVLFGAAAALGQQTTTDVGEVLPSRLNVAVGYNFIRANAPPDACDCFNMNGGFVSGEFQLSPWFGVAGEVTGEHSSKISSLGQNLTLTTFTAGPRISWTHIHFTPYGEFLLGGAHAGDSYFPSGASGSSTASSFAYSAGGGIDLNITPRMSLRAVDAQYLHTAFPNGSNGVQNHLKIGAGIVFHFGSGGSAVSQSVVAPAQPASQIQLTCNVSGPTVVAGTVVHIVGESMTIPESMPVIYSWATSAGVINGTGRTITIDTTNLEPGSYRVNGRAAVESQPSVTSTCEVTFEVTPAPTVEQPASPTPLPTSPRLASDESQKAFHTHVHDAFFDYNESSLRADAQQAVAHDAVYLVAHPDLDITVAGYADERGSDEYNIALGLKRAVMTRDALVGAGVDISRIQVLSYGKEKPFCTEDTDSCYQLNRRAQLLLDATADSQTR